MKKIITFAGIAILFVLFSAPSFSKAATMYKIGMAYVKVSNTNYVVDLYCEYQYPSEIRIGSSIFFASDKMIYMDDPIDESPNDLRALVISNCLSGFIPTLNNTFVFNQSHFVYNSFYEFYNTIPDADKPQDIDKSYSLWINIFELYKDIYGFYPLPGSLWYELANQGQIEVFFPTNTPTPTPTPTPTQIPVQTIFVPSGNGDYTIIYQYLDPSGTIIQSPYNPNVDVNVNVDCDCNSGSNYNPSDPMYAPLEGLSWTSVGGDLTGSPAMTAGESLNLIKSEVDSYDQPIKVVSNSFNALPAKWLGLVGLLGACLIVAGLIRTFLGG